MLRRVLYYLSDYRVLAALALAATAALAYFGVEKIQQFGMWVLFILLLVCFLWGLIWVFAKRRRRREGMEMEKMVAAEADKAVEAASPAQKVDTQALRERMMEAIKAIKSSKIGVRKGTEALYELPWYMIIGNPAAGKSSAILSSGLNFPFNDGRGSVVQGIGGTRNCDWYLTTEGIFLDTAGRYSVNEADRSEWLEFLGLLKKHRSRAPVNGILIATSLPELCKNKPEFSIELAKSLRQRIQEITERLEVHAPVYVIFTKADLIAGFSEFFSTLDPAERENVWGATLPYETTRQAESLQQFDMYFDELAEGIKEMGLSHMAMLRGRNVPPGLLTLPLEFRSIKPVLRTFISTLFEENPYQYKPVFRGFYFTSALQEGRTLHHASERVSQEFGLQGKAYETPTMDAESRTAYFLKNLIRKVIFADRELVQQHSSPQQTRTRYAMFFSAIFALAGLLGLWAWSYTSNQQLIENTTRDLLMARDMQAGNVDLETRLRAILLIQERIEQLNNYRNEHHFEVRAGLYQGRRIEEYLYQEYFKGIQQVMLNPATERLEKFLAEVVSHAPELAQQQGTAPVTTEVLYQEPRYNDANDAYNALKTYLMLGDRSRIEQAHLAQQLTRFWRGWLEANRGQMSREETARLADRLMNFYVASATRKDFPAIDNKMALVSDSRQALRNVMKGQSAIQQVFVQIKARAASRFPTVTVASLVPDNINNGAITGSYAVSGAFTRKAWEEYVRDAFKEAANAQLSANDWVLDTKVESDLSLAGSPEHIARELSSLYKQEYAAEWLKFIKGAGIDGFDDFDQAVDRMGRLGGEDNSPLKKLLEEVNEQTIWDNPVAESKLRSALKTGFIAWFQRVVLRRTGVDIPTQKDPATGEVRPVPMGAVGRAFEGFSRIMVAQEGNPALIENYFASLSKIRVRLNSIKSDSAIGPGASKFVQDTFTDPESELAAGLVLIDEKVLAGLEQEQKDLLRPLLLRPLTETFEALIPVTEDELNKVWRAQVVQPYNTGIGKKFPFDPSADSDASPKDIATIFGPTGAISSFGKDSLGSLVIQRGNLIEPRRWTGQGISLEPAFIDGYSTWVSGSGTEAASTETTIFQILPSPATGAVEYTIEIDGQQLRYRNTPPQWETFQWPNPGAIPMARITAITADGRKVELFNAAGGNALALLIDAANVQQGGDSSRLSWEADGVTVMIDMRTVRRAGSASNDGGWRKNLRLPERITTAQAQTRQVSVPEGAEVQSAKVEEQAQ
ncbi:type VI secretion system membrane subunit TssM [Lysobacteraceae bacterium NML03-0222]|nr:type VI secretion system membrane subunit TssM [Xanthomonadaceae bacterium NML03-0222]